MRIFCLAFALFSFTTGISAQAQTFDETVTYIKDRCVDYETTLSPPKKTISLEISKAGLVSAEYIRKSDAREEQLYQAEFWVTEVQAVGFPYEVVFNCNRLNGEPNHCFKLSVLENGSIRSSYKSASGNIPCSQRKRVANAFKHLQELLTENDPFAN